MKYNDDELSYDNESHIPKSSDIEAHISCLTIVSLSCSAVLSAVDIFLNWKFKENLTFFKCRIASDSLILMSVLYVLLKHFINCCDRNFGSCSGEKKSCPLLRLEQFFSLDNFMC